MSFLGLVTTFAGSTSSSASVDGYLTEARFQAPRSLALKKNGVIYIADSTTIRKISILGIVDVLD